LSRTFGWIVDMPEQIRKLAYSITELTQMAAVGRSFLYDEIKAGRLIVRKAGRRSLILAEDASAWLASLPKVPPAECRNGQAKL
jgi:hypothetical protein